MIDNEMIKTVCKSESCSHDGAESARRELAISRGVPGVLGFMYTTWRNDYTQLCKYAEAIRDGHAGAAANGSG